jgi:hypothetical protein
MGNIAQDGHRDPVERGALRQPWYACACCPPNVMRLLASLDDDLATTDDDGLQIHQYAPAHLCTERSAGRVELSVTTDYLWDGAVHVEVNSSFRSFPA